MSSPPPIFDTALIRRRQSRAMAEGPADFLLAHACADIVERLGAVQRRFTRIADIGTPGPTLATLLRDANPDAMIARCAAWASGPLAVDASAECLPIAPRSLDLTVSALALQTVNDLPGALVQIKHALKPDGLFLASLLGGRTLAELRTTLAQAEVEISGGVSPRVAPFADVRDLGGLLQRAGFALPVADSDVVTVRYDNLFALMRDLRAMGATNSLVARSLRLTRRALFLRAAALYAERFADPDGRIRATFEIVSIAGWAPHESQQAPAERGSGRVSLAAALRDRSGLLTKD